MDQGRLLGVRRETFESQGGCHLVSLAVGVDVQLHPAAVGQLDEARGGRGQSFQVCLGKLHALGFPLGTHGQPVDTGTLEHQLGLHESPVEEEALEAGVAQVVGLLGAVEPRRGQLRQAVLIGIEHPKTWLWSKPIGLLQPMDRRQQPNIVEEFRTVFGSLTLHHPSPFVAVPLPLGSVLFTNSQETDANHLVGQFEGELGTGRMGLAQLAPIGVGLLLGLGAAQFGEQALRQPLHRHHRTLSPWAQQCGRRRMAQDEELIAHQHERRLSDEELTFRQGLVHPIGQ